MKILSTAILVLALPSCTFLEDKWGGADPMGTYMVDGTPTRMSRSEHRASLDARHRAERQHEEQEVAASGRPLSVRERASVVSVAVASTREPRSTRIDLRGFSYVMRGVRRADFFMNGTNAFGGPTGWILYHAEFTARGIHIIRGGLSQAYAKQIRAAMVGK